MKYLIKLNKVIISSREEPFTQRELIEYCDKKNFRVSGVDYYRDCYGEETMVYGFERKLDTVTDQTGKKDEGGNKT